MSSPVTFYFDPACPWTWNTSRWLVDVAAQRDLEVTWRTFSLAVLNEGGETPEHFRSVLVASKSAGRAVEALRAKEGDAANEVIGRFYTELGRRWHHEDEDRTIETVRAALAAVGFESYADAFEDESLDAALRASLAEALALAGPDIGSPVLRVGDHGTFGPIVSPPPTGDDATAVWDAIGTFLRVDGVYEVKRGRSGAPVFGTPPAPA